MKDDDRGDVNEQANRKGVGRAGTEPDLETSIERMLHLLFQRTPKPAEIDRVTELLSRDLPPRAVIRQLMRMPGTVSDRIVPAHNPPGHYFSPVVDPDLVRDYVAANRRASQFGLPGIDFPLAEMEAFWQRNADLIRATPFPEKPDPAFRYNITGGPYGPGDSATLRAMIADKRPKRIIEVGSGYTSAVMMDTADELGLTDLRITCIEPYPARLRSLLRPGDEKRLEIIERGVQGAPLEMFAALEPNDIMFIDSTHVLKTGSDVHYELFYILPALRKGVVVHFHDVRWPIEYSDKQIFEKNYSWNEVYGLQAFLMYNARFRVIFSGSFLAEHRPDMIRETYAPYMRNPGSALWLEVCGDGEVVRRGGPGVETGEAARDGGGGGQIV